MKRLKKLGVLLLAIILVLSLAGCRVERRPEGPDTEETPQQTEETPEIPESISQGEGQEPRLTVHIVETGESREMDFEEYLPGVLAGEMQNDWPMEALKAQAILARTYVMEFVADMGGSKYEGADVSTDIEEAQAWNEEGINERIIQAVNDTRGQVAVHNNEYIKAWFHAHAAGQTAMAVEGLGLDGEDPPYIHSVESPDSEEAPEDDVNWSETFTKAEVIQAVQTTGQEPGDFDSIEVVEAGPSGRAYKLQIGEAVVIGPAFRLALGSTRMKSNQLQDISVEGDQVTFTGTGYGHGVGMSQWGAYQMAEEGRNAEEIVKHYFKDIEVIKLWE
ncbi:stage II sporulation protein D [Clostridium aceticum]|uniref:Stage II sporulation protein D n=1 Tax=Clostridium aceticum TaxID=84022 RepID=A0A0D8IAW1_9CLOT|nr:SpoIID/LytB domain-containing protein [Clostridium aceticum]AKL93633.1 stage II sporulation protein D [Clostridium aceticum]KJF27214.1 stage II sporulation protein SpoIID [Clostridium aceticum]